jgi:dihydroneopterin aldolase
MIISPENATSSTLSVPVITLWPRLGLSDEERSSPQEISVAVEVTFADLPPACTSDQIEGTLCYHTLLNRFQAFIAERSFKLIEHLGSTLGYIVEQEILARNLGKAKARVSIHKLKVPVDELPEGAKFAIEFSVGGVP